METPVYRSPIDITTERLNLIRKSIAKIAEQVGRNPSSIRILASTRSLMVDPVIVAARAGATELAEDFLPEGVTKRPHVDRLFQNLTWHFTGTLPSQKLALAVEFFDWIHQVDRLSLTRRLEEAIAEKKREGIHLLIEVNPLGPKKRNGVSPNELRELVQAVRNIAGAKLEGLSFKTELSISGSDNLTAFREVARLSRELLDEGVLPDQATTVAMGTSKDYLDAIKAGSTMVRLGSAIFGERNEQQFVEL